MSGSTDRLRDAHLAGEKSVEESEQPDPARIKEADGAAPQKWLIESIKEASLNTRRLFIIYLTYIFYSVIAISGTSGKQIVLNEEVRLPVIDAEIPIDQFFFAGSFAAVIIFVYFQIYFFRLRDLKEALICSGGEKELQKIYPWIFNFPKESDSVIENIKKIVVNITVWMSLPGVLIFFVMGFIRKHDPLIFLLFGIAMIGSAIVLFMWKRYFHKSAPVYVFGIIAVTFGLLISLIFLSMEGIGFLQRREQTSSVEVFSKLLENITTVDLTGEKLDNCDFYNRRFEGAKFISAGLNRAVFTRANLRRADFEKAKMEGADLTNAIISEANLNRCSLQEALFHYANLQKAHLVDAKLNNATMVNADLTEADLSVSNLECVRLIGANLSGAKLSGAQMLSAVFSGAIMKGADLSYAKMENADLSTANLEGAILNQARMVNTNLLDAKGLSIEQLSQAQTLFGAKLDRAIEDELKRLYPALLEETADVLESAAHN